MNAISIFDKTRTLILEFTGFLLYKHLYNVLKQFFSPSDF